MFRAFLLILAMAVWGCVLDPGPERRPEILPGSYRAEANGVRLDYDFNADGSYSLVGSGSTGAASTETGRWEYRYLGPDERYLVESGVTRRKQGSDSVWPVNPGREIRYRILASSPGEFHLDSSPESDPGSGSQGECCAFLLIFLLFTGTGHVVFRRQ